MTPFNTIEKLNKIEKAALKLHAQLRQRNSTTLAGTVSESTTIHISKDVEAVDREIQFLYASNGILGGWRKFDDYKKNINNYKGMDELDRDIEKIKQIQFWIPQSKAFVELVSDLLECNETPENLSNSIASHLFFKYTNGGSDIDNLKCALINIITTSNKARAEKSKGRTMNNVTVNGDVNGQFNVAGKSIQPTQPKQTTINISTSSDIQVGDHSVININNAINELIQRIEGSSATQQEKAEAKNKLAAFLAHPLVTSVLGGVAGALVG